MAVLKMKFVKTKRQAKRHLRYIQHRTGKDGQKITRTLFGHDSVLDRRHAYTMLDKARKGTRIFKLMISPDPAKEDTNDDLNLWELTTRAIQDLEKRLRQDIHFVATIHDDHKPHRHIHGLVLIRGRLTREDLIALRQAITKAARFQRQERDLALGYQMPQRSRLVPPPVRDKQSHKRVLQAKPLQTTRTCYSCGEEQPVSIEERRCSTCGVKLRPFGQGYGGAGWG